MRTAFAALLLLASCASNAPAHLAAENALGPYSASVEARGLVFVSGKGGKSGGSFAEEAEGAIRAVEKELSRSQLSLADVLSVTVFLTDMAQYAEFNQVYARVFPAPYPARACVAVSALPANLRVEIQAVASRH
jgi:2-iminobutanoate/2-iminopropanoate deaminase